MSQTPSPDHPARFLASLKKLADEEERGALAALRRGLGKDPGAAPEMFPYVVPWVPADARGWREHAYYLVAALFATHPADWIGDGTTNHNLGASWAWLAREAGGDGPERRFIALLAADREDLPAHLRHAVSLLRTHDIPIDWTQLLRDLLAWDHESRYVQQSWARAFWGLTVASASSVEPATTA